MTTGNLSLLWQMKLRGLKMQVVLLFPLFFSDSLKAANDSENDSGLDFFKKNVSPLLITSCFKCHSHAHQKSKGELFLDSRKALIKGGSSGPSIVPGKPGQSLLISAIRYENEDLQMPPDHALTPKEIQYFETWIAAGAPFPAEPLELNTPPAAWWDQIDRDALLAIDTKPQEAIDYYILRSLEEKGIAPASRARDAALLKRLTLDLAGRPPTPPERHQWLFNPSLHRTRNFVRYLLQTQCFTDHQVEEFNWLLMDGKNGKLKNYLHGVIQENRPWNRVFKEIMLSDDQNPSATGASAFIKERIRDLDRLTNDVSVRFFGINMSCAQCHDHPNVPDWTQARYYGMKSFFSRTFDNGGFVAEKEHGQLTYKNTDGKTLEAPLQFLAGEPLSVQAVSWSQAQIKTEKKRFETFKEKKQPPPLSANSRRARLVKEGLATSQQDYFTRAIINRVWQRLLGTGLVEPLDQLHGGNIPSHPELLLWLSEWFTRSNYNLQGLIEGIVLSQTYQRSSAWENDPRPARHSHAVAALKPLTPRQYGNVLLLGTTAPDKWKGCTPESDQHLSILRTVLSGLPKVTAWFERPRGDFQYSVQEALKLSNAEEVQSVLFQRKEDGLVHSLADIPDLEHRLRTVYLSVLHRLPSSEEMTTMKTFFSDPSPQESSGLKSLTWALLTSPESRFNH
jgi:hypothetical protein